MALLFLGMELFLRFVIPACEFPYVQYDSEHGVLKYDPAARESGVYTIGRLSQQRATWRINAAGWNSTVEYLPPSARNMPLLAIIGDSYVEGFQADIDKNIASVVRRELEGQYAVYGFGMSGASLSQYLQMSRYVREVFDPEILVFVVLHNDFIESVKELHVNPHFLQLRRTQDGIIEAPPGPYVPSLPRRLAGRSALVRFTIKNLRADGLLQRLQAGSARYDASVEVSSLGKNREVVAGATDYIVAKIRRENPEVEVVFAFDGLRRDIYSGEANDPDLLFLHETLEVAARVYGCHFLELGDVFLEDYRANGIMFNTPYDYHWNENGHGVAAAGLLEFLRDRDVIDRPNGTDAVPDLTLDRPDSSGP